MTELPGVAAPLQAALAARGYSTLTPVQQAMLTPDVAGRDLLVSAQTGSGKTVAFGLAIAPELLSDGGALPAPGQPIALAIAPTRELAQQVQRELAWLYSGAQLASCVGGMDFRNERRALERGAHIVVGTPGRLRDHVERGTLDLSALRAVVLDEADEMLDLGFQEDLEFLLAAAPAQRRTLMFSATVPAAIEKLARSYQRDALRIQLGGETRQHVDIAYRAISVTSRDREPAIFNILRLYDARCALIFLKTRANVNNLLARLNNRGFQPVALSGELSQTERMHALQALRDGRARVCVATDVAARGIDLPGLDLVIHADLPSNPETLLHRSGRTGRAGAKGTSVLIVTSADYRKASRLLKDAKVEAEWGSPPGVEEVQAAEDGRLRNHPALTEAPGDEMGIATDLLDEYGPERIAAAFVRMWRDSRGAPEVLSSEALAPLAPAAPPKPRGEFGPSVWFSLTVGHDRRAEARWILPKVCEAGGIAKDGIGAIRVQHTETFVQIAAPMADKFGEHLEIEPNLVMKRLAGEPEMRGSGPAPRPAPREDRAEAPRERTWADKPRAPAPAPEADRPVAHAKPPYQPKPARVVEEEATAEPALPRPAAPRPATPRPVTEDAPRRTFIPRPAGESAARPPRADDDAPRKPRWTGGKPAEGVAKPYGRSPATGGDKPYSPRSQGYKSHGKPYAPRAEGADAAGPKPRSWGTKSAGASAEGGESRPKSWGAKTAGGAKPYARSGDKPFAKPGPKPWAKPKPAAANPADTSRRFVPPRKKGE